MPRSVLFALRLGGTVSLLAIAVISFDALTDLGRQAGLHRLAELFPIAVDAFAASTLYAAYRLPAGHPARGLAKSTARFALVLSVACNVLDHLLALVGYLVPAVVRDLLLVAVASLPQLIADREFHVLAAVTAFVGGDSADDSRPTGHAPAADAHGAPLTVRDEEWLRLAGPVYRRLVEERGRRPTERAFHAALARTLVGQRNGDGRSDRAGAAAEGLSLSTAKRVRALVEANELVAAE